MSLLVCPLSQVETARGLHRPSHLISLLSPTSPADLWPADHVGPHLKLAFHDIAAPAPDLVAPDAALVDQLLAFAATWDETRPMLVHCWAGVSRSTAAAFIVACQHAPGRSEHQIAHALRAAAPYATPNPLMVALADVALERDGAMSAAIASIGRGADTFEGALFEFSDLS
ncbi:tyrosine phosphatase family protein [Caulobacter sp. DWR2-3-1b2]|uniref:tyrosine phosphatase family protein n=1 Tax=Caulobacter sp. DWR2-3-1b2 TaxID=2804642 RepID=UPI003CF6725E